jgi:hypothetical protein
VGGLSLNCVHSVCWPLLAYCTCPGWYWGCRIWWNKDWQGETEVPGENLPQHHCIHHKFHLTRRGPEPGSPLSASTKSYESLLSNVFQWLISPLLWVPEISPCLSYQLLTATAHKDCSLTHETTLHCTALHYTALTVSLIFLRITSRNWPYRKHRSSIAVPLLLVRNLLPSNGRCLQSRYT